MITLDQAESEHYKHHAPYDDKELWCETCEAEVYDLCICDD